MNEFEELYIYIEKNKPTQTIGVIVKQHRTPPTQPNHQMTDPISRNTAFLFIKPHACRGGVEDLITSELARHNIRVDRDDLMSCEQIDEEGIIDRHYSVIAKYGMLTTPDQIPVTDDAQRAFAATFQIDWKDALSKGILLNAKQTAGALSVDATQLSRRWALCQKRVKLMPGLYAGQFSDEDGGIIVLNGFYLANREKFTTAGKKIHWYLVSWEEKDLTWKAFRALVIGSTNPAEAPEGSLRRTIYERWQEFSLEERPNVSDNGVHASAGPIEALSERCVWLRATIRDDFYANSLLLRGVPASLLERVLANQVITVGTKKGCAFDLLEDVQSSEACQILKDVDESERRIPLRNQAFVFIKPHAVNHSTKALVEASFALNGIRVDWEGELKAEDINNRRIIDRHYSAIARYAMEWKPSQYVIEDSVQQMFEQKFHIPWITAVKRNKVFNAVDAALELGGVSAKDLWLLWSAHENRLKLAPGLYVTHFDEQDIYVINGFYLANREKFHLPGKKISWFCVSWDETALTWRDFRALVVGATNPATAAEGSIRRQIFDKWKELGLTEPPNTSDNSIHASASPLEALVERNVWLNQRIESDLLTRTAEQQGASAAFLGKWSTNPIITVEGRTGPAFDLLEDKDTFELIRLLRRAEEETRQRVTENTAFVFVKPHAVTNGTIDLVTQTLKERGFTIQREGSIAAEEIDRAGMIDRHYRVISMHAMTLTPDKISLPKEGQEAFFRKYRITWDEALHEGRIANALDASLQLGKVSPTTLNELWVAADKVKLAPGVYVGYFPSQSIFVINGFYLLNREKFTTGGARIHWFVVSWPEATMTWKDFRANVIGVTDPAAAVEGSLRRTILQQWRGLELKSAPNVSDNGVHASAGPLEALAERCIWLNSDVYSDAFSMKLMFAGVPSDLITNLMRNPRLDLEASNSGTSDAANGFAFDLLEDVQSSDALAFIASVHQKVQHRLKRNYAFLFIKPHAVTTPVRILVEHELETAHVTIENSGVITSERIFDDRLIDRHYAAIARYAMSTSPSRLPVTEDAMIKFENECGVAWSTGITNGTIINAAEALQKFGGVAQLTKKWSAATIKVKLGPGLYVGQLLDDAVYVINGFYPANREKFTAPGKSIRWYTVSWDEDTMTWADFRAKLLGSTDPSRAVEGSIRRRIYEQWRELELYDQPTVSDNGVHASAGPLEGLAERRIWLGTDINVDPFGGPLQMIGMQSNILETLLENPVVSWRDHNAPVFDILEDTQTSTAAAALLDIQCLFQVDRTLQGGDEEEGGGTSASAAGGSVGEPASASSTRGTKVKQVASYQARNAAFMFIKPHAMTSGVVALLEVVFKDHRLRIEKQGEMISDEILQRRIIDRHYATIYRYAEQWSADKVHLSEASATQFKDVFHVSWETAVSDHLVFNASDAAKMLKLSPSEMSARWEAAATKVKIAPGLYIARFLEDDIYVMNGFYLANREKFIDVTARVHWYVVSWNESDLSWSDFRAKIVGPTNPEKALADTIRGTIYREWQALGLRKQPDTADNGVHASAGPLEAFAERRIWLETKLADDTFAKLALQRGSSSVVLQHWATNPVVTVDGVSGYAFDLLEDKQSSEAISALVKAEEVRKAAPSLNHAFVFVKPHAVNRYVYGLVEAALRENKIDITGEGEIHSETIASKSLIDKHYSTIAKYAMSTEPKNLVISDKSIDTFRSVYGVSWAEATNSNIVFNAVQACDVLGKIDGNELNRRWSIYVNRVKLGPGLYVTEFTDEGIYVINGFYLANREKFTAPGKRIHWYTVSWKEADLSWSDFRAKIIGGTDPEKAASSSIRATLWRQWEAIGLDAVPNVSENGIHASAGPLEGLAERFVWLNASIDDDVYGKVLLSNGASQELLFDWITNNPTVSLTGLPTSSQQQQQQQQSSSSTVFDQLEDLQSSQVVNIIREASKMYSASPKKKGAGASAGSPDRYGGSVDIQEVEEAERLKHTNCAFVFIKPHACTKEVTALVDSVLSVNGLHVEASGDMYSYDIEKNELIDKHYATNARYAMDWKATTLKLSVEQKQLFQDTFGIPWDTAVEEQRVLNAVDAAFSLGHLTPMQLAKRWMGGSKRVKLAPGLYIAWLDEDDVYVMNGFYMLTREKYHAPEKKIHWYVISWKEDNISWRDLRAKVIGATNPAEADEGSIRHAVNSEWRTLGLESAPNTSDNAIHISASPLEGLRERMIWLKADPEEDLFGRAALLAGCSKPLLLEWCENTNVSVQELKGAAFDIMEDKQSSEAINILSDATAELMFAPMKHISVTPKRKLFQASVRDLFLNAVTEDELRDLFKLYDPKDTGTIDRASFRKEFEKMESFGQGIDAHELDKLFSKYDRLKNGKMTFEEFVLIMMVRQRI